MALPRSFGTSRRLTPLEVVCAVVGVAAALLVIAPLVRMLYTTFFASGHLDLSAFADAAQLPGIGDTLRNTFLLVGAGGGAALVLGSLFAWLNERTDARMAVVSQVLPALPLLVPPIAIAIGWVFLLSPGSGVLNVLLRDLSGSDATRGPLNIFTWEGLIFLYTIELFPFVYLIMSAALRNLDPALEQASRMSGAGTLHTLRKVTFPTVMPAVLSSILLLVTIGFAIFSVPAIVGTTAGIDVLSTQVVELLVGVYPPKVEVAVVLSSLILVVASFAWIMQARLAGSRRYSSVSGKGFRYSPVKLGPWKWLARGLLIGYILLATLIPVAGLLLVSLQGYWTARIKWDRLTLDNYVDVFTQNRETQLAIFNSGVLGAGAATLGVLIAMAVAVLNSRRTSRFSRGLDGVVKLPAGLSHIVMAVGILLVFGGSPFRLSQTLAILLLGYIVIYLPQGSVAVTPAVSQVSKELLEASQVSGARWFRTESKVAFPLMLPGIAATWALLFVFAVGDTTASVLLAGTTTPTAGYTLYNEYINGTYPTIAALALIISLASATVVLTVLFFTRGKIGIGSSGHA